LHQQKLRLFRSPNTPNNPGARLGQGGPAAGGAPASS
jgi:hypothetical protein